MKRNLGDYCSISVYVSGCPTMLRLNWLPEKRNLQERFLFAFFLTFLLSGLSWSQQHLGAGDRELQAGPVVQWLGQDMPWDSQEGRAGPSLGPSRLSGPDGCTPGSHRGKAHEQLPCHLNSLSVSYYHL